MHIPDSAISPVTSLAAGAVMLPVWAAAGRRIRESHGDRQTPLLAIGAAFCFTIMMFNIPAPGGTTVHPVGGVLLAILLGPAAAVIGMTVALAIQALFFGDGGLLALGANAFTMAFAMPCFGYVVYRVIAVGSRADSPRRMFAAGAGAYLGLNVAALLTALLLGIQPALFHDAAGRALYFPFGLRVTIPALTLSHLLVAGVAEAIVTTAAVRCVRATGIPLHDEVSPGGRNRYGLLWAALAALAALTPLGLLAAGDAWGEWGAADLQQRAGFLPGGMQRVEEHGWKGFQLLPDYLSGYGPWAYAAAAMAGITLIGVTVGLFSWAGWSSRRRGGESEDASSSLRPGEAAGWMLVSPATAEAGRAPRRWRGSGYLERTVGAIAAASLESLSTERWARQAGLLQRIDPGLKVIGLLGLVIVTALAHKPWVLAALFTAGLALGAASRIPLALALRRVWLAVPLFVGLVVLPAALNIVTPGRALAILWREPLLTVTDTGLVAVMLLVFRSAIAVTFGMLLTLTTPWADLLRGLEILRVPRPFLVVIAITFRYLAVLAAAASEMVEARRSRTVGRASGANHRFFVGRAIGALFAKSVVLTEEVHAAMLSRGWTGQGRTLHARRVGRGDLMWIAGVLALAAALVGGEYFA